ncbi:putative bifunctional diguanylate cyclase/phosphodiesterase [Candidatus Blastococcus massiliensis]|uniref:putative bifunctional diguanylate cyclase/phosphodiesterase n=1 Tax=Candidatus Blastococcus massiliensis TaxID=1470358 RepID=UPI00058E7DF0|nr:GGDEF domain-containing phosphodiesterase [Candidatus Blastococcus massiliensis]
MPTLQQHPPPPDIREVTTASVPGQLPAAFPVAPRAGRAGSFAVPAVAAAGAAVVAVLLALSAGAGVLLAAGGLAVVLTAQLALWRRQRRLAGALRRSQVSLRTLVRSSVDPVVILDDALRITFASEAAAELLGLGASDVAGLRITGVIHPDDRADLFCALRDGSDSAVRSARVRQPDGTWRLVQATVRDLRDDPDIGSLVLHCRDVSVRAPAPGADSELLELSLTDPVTGLPNRTALVRRLGAVARETGRRPFSMALIGISGWGPDVLSPGAQSTVLRALTSRLTRALRGEDWLARSTDGDFVVVVDGSIADAEVVAARLIATVGPLATPTGTLPLTAAAGVSALAADLDPGEALRRADLALRSARRAGAGCVHRYDDALRTEQDRRTALRTDLDGALERGELRLVFQPVVDVVLHRTVTVEALLRWRHPVFGDVPPVEFVPLAEETALITDIGRWVLLEACRAVAGLDDAELCVAVNVSARQVRSGELVPDVLAALEASGLHPSRLLVEITESVLLDDAHVIEDLAALRGLGVRIAVDDFGTGWSSLAYLVGMPVDVLKMDQYFLSDVEHDPARRAMCRAVLQLGASLGLPVIVEGVTTPATLALLRDMGHRYLQGFQLSRPLEADLLAAGAELAAEALRTDAVPAAAVVVPALPAPRNPEVPAARP